MAIAKEMFKGVIKKEVKEEEQPQPEQLNNKRRRRRSSRVMSFDEAFNCSPHVFELQNIYRLMYNTDTNPGGSLYKKIRERLLEKIEEGKLKKIKVGKGKLIYKKCY